MIAALLSLRSLLSSSQDPSFLPFFFFFLCLLVFILFYIMMCLWKTDKLTFRLITFFIIDRWRHRRLRFAAVVERYTTSFRVHKFPKNRPVYVAAYS